MDTPDWVATLLAIAGVVAAVAAIPRENRHRGGTVALCLGLVGAALVVTLLPTLRGNDPTPPPPDTPTPGSVETGPTLGISPSSLRVGDSVTFTGSGFEPNSGVAFRFENTGRISWPVEQVFVAADGSGTFREQGTFAINVCGMSGKVTAYYGSNDLVRDATGVLPQPVAATSSVVVRC